MLAIRLRLSYATQRTILPDPLFRIWVNLLHKAKHGSDSGTYDMEGRFRPQSLEDVFAKYDGEKRGGLSGRDVWPCGMGSGALRIYMGGRRRGWSVSGSCFLFLFLLVQRRHWRRLFPVRAGVETGC